MTRPGGAKRRTIVIIVVATLVVAIFPNLATALSGYPLPLDGFYHVW